MHEQRMNEDSFMCKTNVMVARPMQ